MPKGPSQYIAYRRNISSLGSAISIASASTVPVYSVPIFLADRQMIHVMFNVYRATAGTGFDALEIKLVFHYDKTIAGANWYTKVDPMSYAVWDDASPELLTDRQGIIDRQVLSLKNYLPSAFPRTQRYSMIFTTGEMGARLPYCRFAITTQGLPDPGDVVDIEIPWTGAGDPPSDWEGSDPGSGQGGEIDP